MIFGIDPGKTGGIATEYEQILMPTIQIETKPAVTVSIKDSKGNKTYYKTGEQKGQPKRKIKTPAKHTIELNVPDIYDALYSASTIVIEKPGTSAGNSARSTRSTLMNFGKLLAVSELITTDIITVAPNKWKADLNLSKDKLEAVELAEQLSGNSFRTERGALLDGPAEAYLIRYWYISTHKDHT